MLEIEAALHEAGQMLPCEPPHLGAEATLGGMVGLRHSRGRGSTFSDTSVNTPRQPKLPAISRETS